MKSPGIKARALLSAAVFLLAFSLYLNTGSFDVIPDANGGELITAGSMLGIAHPTGYPSWTNLAHGFIRTIPLGDHASRVTILSAVAGALVLAFMVDLLFILCSNLWLVLPVVAAFSTDPLFWKHCISAEVHALHMLIVAVLCWSLVRGRIMAETRFLLLSFFCAGFALSNHMTAVFFLPLLFWGIRTNTTALYTHWPRWATVAVTLFILGWSPNVFLPVRSSIQPVFQWHNPVNIESFLQHVTGAQFRSNMTDLDPDLWISRIKSTPDAIRSPMQFFFLVAGLLGMILGSKRVIPSAGSTAIMFWIAGITLFPLVYAIHDIDSYFLPSVWLLYSATLFLIIPLSRRMSPRAMGSISIPISMAIFLLGLNLSVHDTTVYRQTHLRHYGQSLLMSVPGQGPLCYQNDNALNILNYLQIVEHYRDDLMCVDLNGNINPKPQRFQDLPMTCRATVTRAPGEYPFFKPDGMVFIDRSFRSHWKVPASIHQALLAKILLQDSSWNPYHRELQIQILINWAEHEFEAGVPDTGASYMDRAADLSTNPDTRRFIASILAARGRLDHAIRINLDTLSIASSDAYTMNNTAFYYYQLASDLKTAETLAQKAVLTHPEYGQFSVTLYRILLARGKLMDAAALESRSDAAIAPSLIRERQQLLELGEDEMLDVETIEPSMLLDRVRQLRLPLHQRLLTIRKIRYGKASSEDLQQLFDLSGALGYTNAALAVFEQIEPAERPVNWSVLRNQLQKACFISIKDDLQKSSQPFRTPMSNLRTFSGHQN